MPTFADKLTDEEIDQLAAYVVSLREPSESK
jgi:mono/diheme cytochrome c family protein